MRTIKFRGRHLDSKEWMVGSLLVWPDKECYIIYHADGDMSFEMTKAPLDHSTVGQYTGLKDKNGKEIYEGGYLSGRKEYPDSWKVFPNGRRL